jgi:hypothetical protein
MGIIFFKVCGVMQKNAAFRDKGMKRLHDIAWKIAILGMNPFFKKIGE